MTLPAWIPPTWTSPLAAPWSPAGPCLTPPWLPADLCLSPGWLEPCSWLAPGLALQSPLFSLISYLVILQRIYGI